MTDSDLKNNKTNAADNKPEGHLTNFVRNRISAEIANDKFEKRRWSGRPGLAADQSAAPIDSAVIRTRFPPEPNGYLHIGHAKSICLNFGLARDFSGHCHMRFDDTNPVKEDQEYVDTILDTVRWLGFDWHHGDETNLYYASDYFEYFYQFALALLRSGDAYVDSQSPEQMRSNRGTLTQAGIASPFRDRSIAENIDLFQRMRLGEFADASHIVRAKIDMASPNINLRDPAIFRIRRAHHHRTGDAWCIYPMYDFAHPISDALENITHSICTLEFADHRPFYDWVLEHLAHAGLLQRPLPEQIEFARLNLTFVVTSKRKLQQLVTDGHVSGWDDPRMPTLVGLRRRGYTPEAIQLFCERIGVSKSDGWIDYSVLEQALRDDLDGKAARAMAVIDPIKLVIENMPDDLVEHCSAPVHPHQPERGLRHMQFTKNLWIDRDDFMIEPSKGYFRLFPGNLVRLKYAYVIQCTGYELDSARRVVLVKAQYMPDSRSGTPGANLYKVKGVMTWVSQSDAVDAQVNLYDRLFTEAQPDAGGKDFLTCLNPKSITTVSAKLEPFVSNVGVVLTHYQFERIGYFTRDKDANGVVKTSEFNFAVGLKDTWGK